MSVRSDLLGIEEGLFVTFDVVDVFLLEVLQGRSDAGGRAVAEAAEGAAQEVLAGVGEELEVAHRAAPGKDPLVDADHPVVALAARGALAAGLVRVELD